MQGIQGQRGLDGAAVSALEQTQVIEGSDHLVAQASPLIQFANLTTTTTMSLSVWLAIVTVAALALLIVVYKRIGRNNMDNEPPSITRFRQESDPECGDIEKDVDALSGVNNNGYAIDLDTTDSCHAGVHTSTSNGSVSPHST